MRLSRYISLIIILIMLSFNSPICSASQQISSYLSNANTEYKIGKYEEAIRWLEKALEIVKDKELKTRILFKLGDCYYALKNEIAAFDLYNEALKNPDSKKYLISHPKTYIHLANICFNRAEYKKAAEIYLEIAKRFRNKKFAPYCLVKAADSFLNLKKYKEALELYSKVILLYKDSDEYWISKFRMADIGLSNPNLEIPKRIEYKSYFDPLSAYKEINEEAPEQLRKLKELARLRIATFYTKKKRYAKALSITYFFIKNHPLSPFKDYAESLLKEEFRAYLEELYKNKNYSRICRVYDVLKKFISLSELDQKAIDMIADARYRIGLYKEALRLYLLNPKDHIYEIASIYNLLGRYKDTIDLLMPLRDSLPSNSLSLLAEALYKEGRYKDLVSILKDKNISNIEIYYLVAESYYKLNDLKNASYYYSIVARKESPYQLNAALSLANILFEKKRYKDALLYYEIAQKLCRRCDDSDFIKLQIAECYYFLGDYQKFETTLKRVKKDNLIKFVSNTCMQLIKLEDQYRKLKWLIE